MERPHRLLRRLMGCETGPFVLSPLPGLLRLFQVPQRLPEPVTAPVRHFDLRKRVPVPGVRANGRLFNRALRPLFPHKERLGQFEEVALDLRLAPQPHHGRMFLTGPLISSLIRSRNCSRIWSRVLFRSLLPLLSKVRFCGKATMPLDRTRFPGHYRYPPTAGQN